MFVLKKISFFLFAVVLFACKPNEKKEIVKTGFLTCSLKVSGLNDSITADSVWKISFLPGIESVYINKNDSVLVIKADRAVLSRSDLLEEIEKRGVEILDTF
jgi:hypothetical protein